MILSIITPTFQREKQLFALCLSIQTQVYRPRHRRQVEHIVVSDGPREEDTRAVSDVVSLIESSYVSDGLCVLRHASVPHTGFFGADARDKGVGMATGEWVWFVDDDNVLANALTVSEIISELEAMSPHVDLALAPVWDRKQGKVLPFEDSPAYAGIDTMNIFVRRKLALEEKWGTDPDEIMGPDYYYWKRLLQKAGGKFHRMGTLTGVHV
jgi:glycosyltransferase involved in cell wall biosynthesis